ncbi:hypothetical protein [uncultured Roseovarius sp.]|uniref:hypothetical protein n=1 Tax=uncultured Roseovarius sp. TaxID=293344 RepID=UPI0026122057|nr:hypothetical protein [uncultured Roseovarius sp.]
MKEPPIFLVLLFYNVTKFKAGRDGRYDTAIKWAEHATHRMPNWYVAHFLAASNLALEHPEDTAKVVNFCQDALPEICVKDLDRLSLKDPDKMGELRRRLFKAGFSR